MLETKSTKKQIELLNEFFSFKAEWLKGHLFELYTEPSYFPELTSPRPCMLVGGRGTGKTTTLIGLSYEGRYNLEGKHKDIISKWPYYGIYYRVNTNRVTIFKGPERKEEGWIKLFAHYFNLLICEKILQFLIWYQKETSIKLNLSGEDLKKITLSLNLNDSSNLNELHESILTSIIKFEAQINNILDFDNLQLSAQGAPIDVLFGVISSMKEFSNKHFFILLDEYENFLDYQQRVVNTLIKHAASLFSFKVGVRELGLRKRTTLIQDEQLISPADYDKIDINEKLKGKNFKEFALRVCNTRLSKINLAGKIGDIKGLFPGLSEDVEAAKLGITHQVEEIKNSLKQNLTQQEFSILSTLTPLEIYLLKFWSDSGHGDLLEQFRDFQKKPKEWKTRLGNNKHSLLYTIKKGKSGIRKFYCGWDVLISLAGNNIRYLLELVDKSLKLHIADGNNDFSKPVNPENQTKAAQSIGQKNLSELEGLSVDGAQLTKLLLGLGRIFQVMAFQANGHAPEVNQFHVSDEKNHPFVDSEAGVDNLLKAAVRHLALIRNPGNKLTDETETREYDYMVHPIFSAFFIFSYRQKRKMILTTKQIMGLVNDHQKTIKDILTQNKRIISEESEILPDQLSLFESYYHGIS